MSAPPVSTPPAVRVAAYVDGFNLYNGMHDARGRRGLWLDLESMLGSLLRPGQQLVTVHYFTALVVGPGRPHQETYLKALEEHGQLTVSHVGRFQRKTFTCRGCGRRHLSYEEKESDVHFGAQLVEDAAQNVFDTAMIVSSDSDMLPAVRSARRLRPNVRILAAFPPRRSSAVLSNEVDATLRLFIGSLSDTS